MFSIVVVSLEPHDSFSPISIASVGFLREKAEPCFVVVIFVWNMFDLFQPNVPLMKKLVFS